LVSELRLTAGCVLMDLASPAVSGTSAYANGLKEDMLWKYKPLDHVSLQLVGQLDHGQQTLPQQVSSGYQDLEPEHQVHTAQKCHPGA